MNTLGATSPGLRPAAETASVRALDPEAAMTAADVFGAVLGAMKDKPAADEPGPFDPDRPAGRRAQTSGEAGPAPIPVAPTQPEPVNPLVLLAAVTLGVPLTGASAPVRDSLETLVARALPSATPGVPGSGAVDIPVPADRAGTATVPPSVESPIAEAGTTTLAKALDETLPEVFAGTPPDASEARTRVTVLRRETHFAPVLPRVLAAPVIGATTPRVAAPSSPIAAPDAVPVAAVVAPPSLPSAAPRLMPDPSPEAVTPTVPNASPEGVAPPVADSPTPGAEGRPVSTPVAVEAGRLPQSLASALRSTPAAPVVDAPALPHLGSAGSAPIEPHAAFAPSPEFLRPVTPAAVAVTILPDIEAPVVQQGPEPVAIVTSLAPSAERAPLAPSQVAVAASTSGAGSTPQALAPRPGAAAIQTASPTIVTPPGIPAPSVDTGVVSPGSVAVLAGQTAPVIEAVPHPVTPASGRTAPSASDTDALGEPSPAPIAPEIASSPAPARTTAPRAPSPAPIAPEIASGPVPARATTTPPTQETRAAPSPALTRAAAPEPQAVAAPETPAVRPPDSPPAALSPGAKPSEPGRTTADVPAMQSLSTTAVTTPVAGTEGRAPVAPPPADAIVPVREAPARTVPAAIAPHGSEAGVRAPGETVEPRRTETVAGATASAEPVASGGATNVAGTTDLAGPAAPGAVVPGALPFGGAPQPPAQQVAAAILGQIPRGLGGAVPGTVAGEGPLRLLTLQLHPADLGTVLVRMRLRDGQLELSLHASREETAHLLREGGEVLGDLLRQGGYQPERVTILSGAPTAGALPNEGQGFQPQADAGANSHQASPDQPGRRQPEGQAAASSDTSERIHESVPSSPDRSGVYL